MDGILVSLLSIIITILVIISVIDKDKPIIQRKENIKNYIFNRCIY